MAETILINSTVSTIDAIVEQVNQSRVNAVGSLFHYDRLAITTTDGRTRSTSAVTIATADATNTATAIVLANEAKRVYNLHCAEGPTPKAHKVADTDNAEDTADATSLATAIALANALKASFNLHCAETAQHANADSTNPTTEDDATVEADLVTLVNALKADINAHMASAPGGFSLAFGPL